MLKFIVNGKEVTEDEIRDQSNKENENIGKQFDETYNKNVSIIIED